MLLQKLWNLLTLVNEAVWRSGTRSSHREGVDMPDDSLTIPSVKQDDH